MTPKDKAFELYFKYEKELRVYQDNGFYYDGRKTKNACLIAVDFAMEFITGNLDEAFDKTLYLFEVKEEIENL
jgi:hypothetical protein